MNNWESFMAGKNYVRVDCPVAAMRMTHDIETKTDLTWASGHAPTEFPYSRWLSHVVGVYDGGVLRTADCATGRPCISVADLLRDAPKEEAGGWYFSAESMISDLLDGDSEAVFMYAPELADLKALDGVDAARLTDDAFVIEDEEGNCVFVPAVWCEHDAD